MAQASPTRAWRAALLPAALLAAVPAAAQVDTAAPGAASGALQLQTVVGFSDTFRPGRWTPVTVIVSSRGGVVDGHLEVITTGGDAFREQLFEVTHRQRLELSGEARKRFHFTVLPESLAHPLLVRARVGDTVIAQQRIDLRQRFTAERLLLVVSRDANLDYLNDPRGQALRVLYPHPQSLPDHWQGYDAVAAVILHGQSLDSLSARQYEALRKWIAAGGTLAVAGGPDYARLRTARLAALLPATPVGMHAIADRAAVGAALGVELPGEGAIQVNRVTGVRGELRASAAGVPLLLARRWGQGSVLYLTFDIARRPFDRSPGLADLWSRVLELPDADADAAHAQPVRHASPVPDLIAASAQDFPGHGTALLFMGLYLVLLLTAYRAYPASPRLRRVAALVPFAAPLLFAPAAYLLFGPLLFQRGASAAVVSVIEPLGASPYARVHLDLGVYANRHGPLQLHYEGLEPTLHAPAHGHQDETPPDWVFGEDARRSAAPGDARAFVLHLLQGRDVTVFDLQAAVHRGDAEPRLVVRNDSGRRLEDAWLIWNGGAWPLGAIAGDARIERTLDPDPYALDSPRDEWWDVLVRHPGDTARGLDYLRPMIARAAAGRDAGGYPGRGHALLMARTASPLRLAGASAPWQQAAQALVLFRFAVPPAPGGAKTPGDGPEDGTENDAVQQ
jgi:hypothetical protein